jgi:predicted transposase YbfD/YdcC
VFYVGAKDWEEIVQAAEGMIDWISKYVDTSSGIPFNATLKRVMSLIPTKSLEILLKSIRSFVSSLKADYVLPVKENHKSLYDDIHLLFQDADNKQFKGIDADSTGSLEKSAGRLEKRYYELIDAEELPAAQEWEFSSVGRVTRERTKKEKTSVEVCYYITTLELEIEKFARGAREHWGVENGLH